MRFSENGPDIPDRLLWERDEGNVIFMCGAGVSAHRAKLPDFFELASKVMKQLQVPDKNRARRIFNISQKDKLKGLVSVDKIFGELEREYPISDIERAVEKSIDYPNDVDIESHRIICDLSTVPEKGLRLITTNFDDLFSQVRGEEYREWICSDLPDINQIGEFTGLVYLHGKKRSSMVSQGGKFVLSTRSFGEAYLADGWASEFLKNVLKKFTVVFVGYSAEDPPMQYLLEALAQTKSFDAYAFQHGNKEDAEEKWKHKGVTSICFKDYDRLWETLKLWSDRANDFKAWASSILDVAQPGPYNLGSWQRSQVKHLIEHPVGAKFIAAQDNPISPRWLFTLDPKFRYATPIRSFELESDSDSDFPDPFDLLCFEDDEVPPYLSSDDPYSPRVIPENAWDAFEKSSYDQRSGSMRNRDEGNDNQTADSVSGSYFNGGSDLPHRLISLSQWILNVSRYPITIRWAIHQQRIDPKLCKEILDKLGRSTTNSSSLIYMAWEEIFECWKDSSDDSELRLMNLRRIIDRDTWTHGRVLQYQDIMRPRLCPVMHHPSKEIHYCDTDPKILGDIVKFSVNYFDTDLAIDSNSDWVGELVRADRDNLDLSIRLEKQVMNYGNVFLPNILASDAVDPLSTTRLEGINAVAFRYLDRFKDLLNLDLDAARVEFSTWPSQDFHIYEKFLIWALNDELLLTPTMKGKVILGLSQEAFWGPYHRYDFCHALLSCWNELSPYYRSQIVKRITRGRNKGVDEDEVDYIEGRSEMSLNMISYLKLNGCKFDNAISKEISILRKTAKSWKAENAKYYDKPIWTYFGRVETITDHRVLDDISTEEIIDVADQDRGYSRKDDPLIEIDRFKGLCEAEPGRAFAALISKSRKGEYPDWAWRSFLSMSWEGDISSRYLSRTTATLCAASSENLLKMKGFIFNWFESISCKYGKKVLKLRDFLFFRLVDVIQANPSIDYYTIDERSIGQIDWTSKALNSSTGTLTRGLMGFSEFRSQQMKQQISSQWLKFASYLLSLKGNNGRFALVVLMRNLPLIHFRAPRWTRDHILRVLEREDSLTSDAYWEGLAHSIPWIANADLFLEIKKSLIKRISESEPLSEKVIRNFASIILYGWISEKYKGDALFSNSEFTEAMRSGSEFFRISVLVHMWSWTKDDSKAPKDLRIHKVEKFLLKVWPLNRRVISSLTNIYLLKLVFFDVSIFSKYYNTIVPRLGRSKRFDIFLRDLDDSADEIAKQFPVEMIDILYKIFPEVTPLFLPNVKKLKDMISTARSTKLEPNSDRKALELLRKVNSF